MSGEPLHIIAPFARGGATDLVTRIYADALSKNLGIEIEITNEPGAGGTRAAERVARAKPDGRTVVMGSSSTHGICSAIFTDVPYEWPRDFVPIAPLVLAAGVLVVSSASDIDSVADVIEKARASPGKLTFGSAGFGQTIHLSGELFRAEAAIDIVHAPRLGSAVALEELVAGRLSLMFDNILSALPYIESGKLRALAVTGAKRVPQLPAVKTMIEEGFADFDVDVWIGMLAPRGTPQEDVDRLARATREVLALDDVRERLQNMGAEVFNQSRAEFTELIQRQASKWSRIVKRTGIAPVPL